MRPMAYLAGLKGPAEGSLEQRGRRPARSAMPELTATAIAAAAADGGGSEWSGEHHGVMGIPFWGFGGAREVREWGGGGHGARPKQSGGAAAFRRRSGQIEGRGSISE